MATYTSETLSETTQFRAVVQSGVCSATNSTSTTVTVDPTSEGGAVSGGTTICSGSTSGLLTLGSYTGTIIKWQSSVSPFTSWTDISNTLATYTSEALSETTQFRAVIQSGVCSATNSTPTTVTVDPTSVGGAVSGGTTICSGSTSGLLTLGSYTGTIIKWQSSVSPFTSWTDISNTLATYTSGALSKTTEFRAVVQNGTCPEAYSDPTTVTVNPASVGGSVTGGTSVCYGSNSGLLTLTGQTGTVVKWQSGVLISGTWTYSDLANTNTTYTSGPLTQNTRFRAFVKSGTCSQAISANTLVTVNPLSVGGAVASNQTICSGSTPASLTLSGNTGSVVRWEKSSDVSFTSPITIVSTSITLTGATIGNLSSNTYFRAVVKSGACSQANSDPVLISVDPTTVGGTVTGTSSICFGNTSGLLSLTGYMGTVQKWQSTVSPFTVWTDITNTNDSYTSGPLSETTRFRAVVKSGVCLTLNSGYKQIVVKPNPTFTTGTVSPSNCYGDDVLFTASGLLPNLNNTFYSTITYGSTVLNVTRNVTSDALGNVSYTGSGFSPDNYIYELTSIAVNGCTTNFTDMITNFVVHPLPTASINGTATACVGSTPSPEITFTGAGGTSAYSFTYTLNSGGNTFVTSVGNSITVPQSTINSGEFVYDLVSVSDVYGCSQLQTGSASITVDPTSNGGSISGTSSITYGSSTGTMTLGGFTGIIQGWEKKLNLGSWTTISNTNDTYSEYPTTAGTWYYRAIVKNGVCSETTSTSFTLTVNKAPLTVTANNKSKVYGATDPNLDYTASGTLYYSDTYSVITGVNLSTTIGAAATYGTHDITATGGTATNYEVTHANGTLTVSKAAALTVTANSKSKVYGAIDPALDYSITGTFYYTDDYSVITGVNLSTTIGAAATFGTHPITASGGTATNYEVTHVAGTLTVSKATLTVINALAHDKIYDTYTTAIVSGAQLNGVLYSGTVNLGNSTAGNFAQANVGSHIAVSTAMTISGADAFNYNLTQPNYLTADITPKDLSITADNKSKDYDGLVYSPFTVTYNGFEGGQTSSVLGGTLSFSGSATTSTDVGTYTIIPSGQTSNNYAITYYNGTLTINCNTPVNVTNTSNSGYGSLRNAIANVCEPGTIYFNSALDIPLSSGLVINKNITFDNDCALTNGITIRGSGDIITINSGKTLTLSACSKITVSGTIKNNAGVTGIVISSGASFIQNTANLPATAKRVLSQAWHLFGSPFQQSMGVTLSNINTGVGTVQLKPYTNGTNWLANVTSAYYFLQPTVGYAVCPSTVVTASLSGNLFNGLAAPCDYSISLVYNGTAATQSWNLVANPYPSYLNWNSLGKTNISTTLYLWNPAVMGPPVTNTSYFSVYNSANGVGVPSTTKQFIAPLQGFFVRAIYTNPRITLPLSARTHTTGTFYKEADNTEILVRLKTETDMGMDEMVICKNPDALLTYEDYDSEKMFDGLPVGMYSQAASGEKLVINTINDTNTIIPLSIMGSTGDKATITAFDLESSIPVYLEDRLKGKITNLSENSSYNFEFPTNEVTGRFFIRFNNSNAPLTTSAINVFASNQKLNIIAQTGEEIQEVEVFTLTGACVFKATPSSINVFTETLNLSSAIYLVKVKTSLATKNVKVSWE